MTKHPTLDDVLARPDDLELRMVWADALQQAGDPRGELAAIQLAGRPTYEAWAREQALIALHGARWAEPLAEYFDAPYVFEGGLFAGGTPSYEVDPLPDDFERRPGASFAEPGWRAVTTLVRLDHGRRILDDARVPVRHLRRLWESTATALLAKYREIPLERIVELGVKAQGQGFPDTALLRTCDALPNLRTLTVVGPRPHLTETLVDAPVLGRIERLGLEELTDFNEQCVTRLLAAAQASTGALREVVLRFYDSRDVGWRVTLRREEPGPFTSIVAWWHLWGGDRPAKKLVADCVRVLDLVDHRNVRSLAIEVGRPMRFPTDVVRSLAAQLAEMPLEHCVVPWPVTPLRCVAAGERQWEVRIDGCDALAQIDHAWQVFGPDLGVPWDAMSVDGRGTPALGKQPLATLRKRTQKPIDKELTLIRTGSTDAIRLARSDARGTFTSARSPAEIATWFAGAVAKLAPTRLATCALVTGTGEVAGELDLETYGNARIGWIVALPPEVSRGLTAEHLAKLGASTIESPDRAVFTIGDDPAAIDDARVAAFAAGLVEVLDALRAPEVPAWFAPQVRELVAPIAARTGQTLTCDTPMRLVWSGGQRFIRVRLDNTRGEWRVKVIAHHYTGESLRVDGPDEVEIAIGRFERVLR